MARRHTTYTVTAKGRDQGKVFVITEMEAEQGEEWAFRALCALAKAGVEMPEDWDNLSMATLSTMALGALAGVPFEEAKPLLDEMMACVTWADPSKPNVTRDLIKDDIEEIATRLMLRKEVWSLHVDFFTNAAP